MEFEELNIEDKKDALDLMCILSANMNHLYGKDDIPERTEDQVLDECSDKVKEWWGEYLFSKLKEK